MSKKKHPRKHPQPHRVHPAGHAKVTVVAQELHRAEVLLARDQPEAAIHLLESLTKRTPPVKEALPLLATAYQEAGDLGSMALAFDQYLRIAPQSPDAAEMLLNIAAAYTIHPYPALAVRTLHRFLDRFPDHPEAGSARAMLEAVEPVLQQDLLDSGVPVDHPVDFAAQHEEAQIYLARGDFATARRMELELVRQLPTFVSALNNISQISLLEGNIEEAIAITQRVLTTDPDNIHARSNLIRYLCISGRREEARPLADQLLALSSPLNDTWVKQVEAFTFLQDNARVWATYQGATKQGVTKDTTANPIGLHLAAVAAWHLGHERKARSLWKQALDNDPHFALAQANLDDLAKPVAQRHAPWPFEMGNWLNPRTMRDLRTTIANLASVQTDDRVERALRAFAGSHPDFVQVIPSLLACGDPMGRTFAVRVAAVLNTAATNAALQEFVISPHGPDDLRLEALSHLTRASVVPPGPVRLWMRGEWTDVLSMEYEITDEPEDLGVEEVNTLYIQALDALHADDGVTAESALRAALEMLPDNPRLRHNLGYALEVQGRHAEAREVLDANFAQHPDYLFARLGVASYALRNDRIAEAEELGRPLLTRTRFHFSEFEAFADFQVRLAIAKSQPDAAIAWINMWENILPESPKLQSWQATIDSLRILSGLQSLQSRRRTPKKQT
jgi:tetratricopeptide (TPR) repeat protein